MWSIRSWYERVPRTADEPNRGQANIRKGLKAKSFKIFLKKSFFVLSIGTIIETNEILRLEPGLGGLPGTEDARTGRRWRYRYIRFLCIGKAMEDIWMNFETMFAFIEENFFQYFNSFIFILVTFFFSKRQIQSRLFQELRCQNICSSSTGTK